MTNTQYDLAQLKRPVEAVALNHVCGDDTWVHESDQHIFLAIFDGAGHGLTAARIADKAMDFIQSNYQNCALDHLLQNLHEHLKGTDGGVAAICKVDKLTKSCECIGVGNIFIRLCSDSNKAKNILIRGGILGYEITSPKSYQFILNNRDILILYSDGIKNHFDLSESLGGYSQTSEQIAKTLINEHAREHDDASVIVLRVSDD